MRRSTARQLVQIAAPLSVALALAFGSNGCDDLKLARSQSSGGTLSAESDGGADGDASVPTMDGGTKADAPISPTLRPYYADVQAALATKRFAGPTTGPTARGHCTPSYFVWIDQDKAVHSWRGSTKAQLDYGFLDNGYHSYFFPSDTFFSVDRPFVNVDVYRMDVANTLVTSLPYTENFVTADNGVVLLDQKLDFVDLGGTKVRRWNAASMTTEDITGVLPTREKPSSFNNDTLVIPGGQNAPFLFHIVDVVKKTAKVVTYSDGKQFHQTEQSVDGLLVSYSSSSTAGPALRLYKGNVDTAAARIELAADINGRPAHFEDPPTNGREHTLQPPFATWGKKVLFATEYGIWSYDLSSKVLVPVQLNAMKVPGGVKLLCVMRDAGLLIYQNGNDLTHQIWAVPLSATFP